MALPSTDGKATRPQPLGLLPTELTQLTLSSPETGIPDGLRNKKWTTASLVCGTSKERADSELGEESTATVAGCGLRLQLTPGICT